MKGRPDASRVKGSSPREASGRLMVVVCEGGLPLQWCGRVCAWLGVRGGVAVAVVWTCVWVGGELEGWYIRTTRASLRGSTRWGGAGIEARGCELGANSG